MVEANTDIGDANFVSARWRTVMPVGNGESRERLPQFRDRQTDAVGDA
ncbi:hypothetical protein EEB18_015960 [Sphingopyxis sp. OPL5]|nr:hypothetical protein [Sphingopyxis sp. OPL5]QNO26256.1 hypothetical protein EEB18_015960 [Sphingopyxis sp. OPL5]